MNLYLYPDKPFKVNYNFISIEGVIGAGKTALAGKLAEYTNARLILEQFEENAFLPRFYKEPSQYAFPLEMSFMASRYQQLKDALGRSDLFQPLIVSDYLFDKSMVFSRITLAEDEYRLFSRFFGFIVHSLPKPDLVIYLYLNVSNLQLNIKKRGRPYEQTISDSYLDSVQKSYLDYFNKHKGLRVLIIDTNNVDFVRNPHDFVKIINLLNSDYPYGITYLNIPKSEEL